MVEELFRQDAYLKEADATVTAVDERGVRLDRSIFYPTGGGHPRRTRPLPRQSGGAQRAASATTPGAGRGRLLRIEGVDLQACGGTHVAQTAEIGRVECTKIENKGKMNRRFIIALP